MNRSDGRAYLRSLAALHLSFVLFALGGLVTFAGLPGAGGPMVLLGVVIWTLALIAGFVRAARQNRGKPFFGGDGIQSEANWWLGWGPMEEAAVATGCDAHGLRRMAIASIAVAAASFALWFPVAALTG